MDWAHVGASKQGIHCLRRVPDHVGAPQIDAEASCPVFVLSGSAGWHGQGAGVAACQEEEDITGGHDCEQASPGKLCWQFIAIEEA